MKRLILIILTIFFLFSCKEEPYQTTNGISQGTTYHIVYKHSKKLDKEIDSILNYVDNIFSLFNENSLISKINRNENVELNEDFIKVFNKAMQLSKLSDGRYDITVKPLVSLYGFLKEKKLDTITDEMIDSILQFVGYNKISIKNGRIEKLHPNIQLDMNSISQGYTCDLIGDFFEKMGIRDYMIEIGGEILVRGSKEMGQPWKIGIERPIENTDVIEREIELVIALKNEKKGIATSGNYRKFYYEKGVKFSHSINPFTGKPVRDSLLSVTIIADDGITADGLATACLVSGFEKAKLIVQKVKVEAFMIYLDKKGNYKFYFTPDFQKYILEMEKQKENT